MANFLPTAVQESERRELTPDEQEQVNRRIAAFAALMQREPVATYRLEVQFNANHRNNAQKLSPDPIIQGLVSFWRNASAKGRGEEKVYECPGKRLEHNSCIAFMPDVSHGMGIAICPACGTRWQPEQLTGEVGHARTRRGWADVLYHYMVKMEGDCDIILKHPTEMDLRLVTAQELDHDRGGEVLRKARAKRQENGRIVRYILKDFIHDVSAGADPLERLHAFLSA